MGYAKPRQIFPEQLESELEEYIKHSSRTYYGLTPQNIKVLYQLTNLLRLIIISLLYLIHGLTIKWQQRTGSHYLWKDMNYQSGSRKLRALAAQLALIKPMLTYFLAIWNIFWKNTNLKIKSFGMLTKPVCKQYRGQIKLLQKRSTPSRKSYISRERSNGYYGIGCPCHRKLSPSNVCFPQVFFKDHFINNRPPGCIRTSSYPSGWITSQSFFKFINIFTTTWDLQKIIRVCWFWTTMNRICKMEWFISVKKMVSSCCPSPLTLPIACKLLTGQWTGL